MGITVLLQQAIQQRQQSGCLRAVQAENPARSDHTSRCHEVLDKKASCNSAVCRDLQAAHGSGMRYVSRIPRTPLDMARYVGRTI